MNNRGNSRKHLVEACEASLKRLKVRYRGNALANRPPRRRSPHANPCVPHTNHCYDAALAPPPLSLCSIALARAQTPYIDLYQLHGDDVDTPLSETFRTLNDLVRSGKVRMYRPACTALDTTPLR